MVITGPTASGKSALALALSRLTPSVIINADASQVYRDLGTVTARPTIEEEAEAPHRLFGHVDGAIAWSAAAWAVEARSAVAEAHDAGRLPILVGGTGMYIRTLLDGIAPVPDIDPDVRQGVRDMPVGEAHAALTIEDPEAAARLAPADTTRVARALEVVRSTRRTLRDWQAERVGGIGNDVRIIGCVLVPPRNWLFASCDERFEAIFEPAQGEVGALIARALDPRLPVMRAIGVAEIAAYQARKVSKVSAVEAGQLATRQYAKRQYTWFRNQSPDQWQRRNTQLDSDKISNLATLLHKQTLT